MADSEGREGLLVDFDTGILRRDHVLVHATPSVVLTLGFGPRSAMLHRFALGEDSDGDPFIARCRDIAEVVEGDELAKADQLGAWQSIANIEYRFLRRLAIAEALAKSSYDPDEPRDGHGRWTSDGGESEGSSTMDANIVPAAASSNDVLAMKGRFVDAHLADAQKAADKSHVPVENILGLSALESGWGKGSALSAPGKNFVTDGNNFFGIQYPAPFANGWILTPDGKIKVATFASYADSLKSFVAESGAIIQGISDPRDFAAALQNSVKFGINRNGTKVPDYVDKTADTIRRLGPIVARRRA